MKLLLGILIGILITTLVVKMLYGAKHPMQSGGDKFRPSVYYVVGNKRFSWFDRSSRQNCWGGYTLDGRCITAIYVSRGNEIEL